MKMASFDKSPALHSPTDIDLKKLVDKIDRAGRQLEVISDMKKVVVELKNDLRSYGGSCISES